jgi:hypothetical protein
MTRPTLERHDLDRLALGGATFDWELVPTGLEGSTGWMHSGIAVLTDGSLVVAHPEGRRMVRISTAGASSVIPTDLTEMHCIVTAAHRGGQILWVADNGHRYVHGTPSYGEVRTTGRLAALDLQGKIVDELVDPQVRGDWSPTSVAVVDPTDPGSDLWVADGYGQSLVHRYASDGTLLQTIDGAASGTRFDCPHGLLVRSTSDHTELYVADRGNRRIVVFDLAGSFGRVVGAEVLDSPSSMVDLDGHLVVTELFGAVAVFDGDDYAGHFGSSSRDHQDPVWPNRHDDAGRTVAPEPFDGTFNSPHGLTTHDGDLYLTEWMIGGRVVRLRRSGPPDAASTPSPSSDTAH